MKEKEHNCAHTCKNSCSSLNEALRKETATVRYYESIIEDCNSPEIREFLNEIIETRRQDVLKIIQKLNEIHARSGITDGVISSFHSETGNG